MVADSKTNAGPATTTPTDVAEKPTTYGKRAQTVAVALIALVVLALLLQSYFQMRSRSARHEKETAQDAANADANAVTIAPNGPRDFRAATDQAKRELAAANAASAAESQKARMIGELSSRTQPGADGAVRDARLGTDREAKATPAQIEADWRLDEERRVLMAGRAGFLKLAHDDQAAAPALTMASGRLPAMPAPPTMSASQGGGNAAEISRLQALVADSRGRADAARAEAARLQDVARQMDPTRAAQMLGTSGSAGATQSVLPAGAAPAPQAAMFAQLAGRPATAATDGPATFGEAAQNRAFLTPQAAGPRDGEMLLPTTTVISAVVKNDTMSDYNGDWLAEVQRPVLDPTGEYILLPIGTRITGKTVRASGVNEVIQNRVAYTVQWAIRPDGKRIDFHRAAGMDVAGVAALKDQVDYHVAAQVFGVLAYAVVGLGPAMSTTSTAPLSSRDLAVQSASDQARMVGQNFAAKYLQIVPTVTIRGGTPMKIFLEDDIYVTPWASIDARFYAASGHD